MKFLKNPVVTLISVTLNVGFVVLQFADVALSVEGRLNSREDRDSEYSKSPIGIVEYGNFQNSDFDILSVAFSNPTKKTQTIMNVRLHCTARNGPSYLIHPSSNNYDSDSQFDDTVVTKLNLDQGEAKQVTFYFSKREAADNLSAKCSALEVQWSNSEFVPEFSDEYPIERGVVFFTSTIYHRL